VTMPKYIVSGTVTISCMVEVEAESAEAAREAAEGADMMTLCYQCSHVEADVWCAGELDGIPEIESVELKHATPTTSERIRQPVTGKSDAVPRKAKP
jgi:hypothetical protein